MQQQETTVQRLLFTVEEAGDALGVGKDMIYSLINRGEGALPVLNLARSGDRPKLRISVEVLKLWILEQTRQQNPHSTLLTSSDADTNESPRPVRKSRVRSRVRAAS